MFLKYLKQFLHNIKAISVFNKTFHDFYIAKALHEAIDSIIFRFFKDSFDHI